MLRDQEIPPRSGERYIDRAAPRTPEGPQAPEVRPGAIRIVRVLGHDEDIQRTAGNFLVVSAKAPRSEDVDLVIHVIPDASGDGRCRGRGGSEDETTSEIPARARTPPTISKIRKTLTKAIIALDQAPPASVCRPSARGLPHGRTPRGGNWSEKP